MSFQEDDEEDEDEDDEEDDDELGGGGSLFGLTAKGGRFGSGLLSEVVLIWVVFG